jgi:ABC-2 type transport system permease protein
LRYLRLFFVQLRVSIALGAAYRADFVLDGLLTLFWITIGITPLYVAFEARPVVGGWTYERALLVVGWFVLLKGVLEGAVNPSLAAVVEQIRQGTLDFVLLRPKDSQFLVSTSRFEVFRLINAIAAFGIFAWAFSKIGRLPGPGDVALALVLFAAAVLVLYSIWILVIAAAFWVVRLDNLSYLLDALFDFARWPASVFKGVWAFVFTFVIPLALMTTYPAEALLGALEPARAAISLAGSVAFAGAARLVWRTAIRRYTSASS